MVAEEGALMDDYAAFNAVYLERFPGPVKPARVCIGVAQLPLGALVEVEAEAAQE